MGYKDPQRQKEYQRVWFQENKHTRQSTRPSVRAKQFLIDCIKNVPCLDCQNEYPPWVMDFDHREGEQKVGGISRLLRTHKWKYILIEIAKCDIVCANCHRNRTWKRSNTRL